jgi:hypothetical protein
MAGRFKPLSVPTVVSVTALRDAQDAIIGYLLIGSPARGISGHEDCGTDGRSRVHWRCMDGLSAAREDSVCILFHLALERLDGILGNAFGGSSTCRLTLSA